MTDPERAQPRTLFQKVWDQHVVCPESPDVPATIYVDLHLVHEVTSPQAFARLRQDNIPVRRPDRTIATMDHSTPTTPWLAGGAIPLPDRLASAQLATLAKNCEAFGVPLFTLGSQFQGIVHVIGPELGLTQPGMTIVCGDSHTSTHGAFGALAFGIGTSEVGHVLATQCLLQKRPRTFEIRVDGRLAPGISAKDIILSIVREVGVDGGTGYVFEYTGEAVTSLDMEGRMTVCNMSIEAGARAGMIGVDLVTLAYLQGRPFAPRGEAWERACERWRALTTDTGATFARRLVLDATRLEPMITYGTNPGMSIAVTGQIPDPDSEQNPGRRQAQAKALAYMGLSAGQTLQDRAIDVVFIGSCTNARISDLRAAASILNGRQVANGVRALVVPGSAQVKAAAEAEGLAKIFVDAGAEWREAGCSMCIAMNNDKLEPGQYAVSTSNRNFEGRQGPGSRTFLASPLSAAAAAVAGRIADPREFLRSDGGGA